MTPTDILRIARASRPDTEWQIVRDRVRGWRDPDNDNGPILVFDPLNDSADAFAVQCWFLAQCYGNTVGNHDADCWIDGRLSCISHDGTEAGLRRALVEAAKRVLGEKGE